ncbi:MAG: hypothetical protein ACRD9Q_01935, partial [Nitrososphaeraceae archaeon]
MASVVIAFTVILFLIFVSTIPHHFANAQEKFAETEFVEEGKPKLFDSNFKISTVAEGLSTPTSMAFVGPGDILVL